MKPPARALRLFITNAKMVTQDASYCDRLLSRIMCNVKRSSRKELKIQSISPSERGFYSKRLDYKGIAIKSSSEVANQALFEAWQRLNMMLCNEPNITANLSSAGAQLHIIGKNQATSDLPENHHLKGSLIDDMDIDERTRGTGGLLASCGEENLLKLIPDRYHGRDICVHEFAHTILNYGVCETVREHVVNHYKWSVHKGLWKGCYAATNYDEFFAELSMWYFGTTGDPGLIDPPPNKGAGWLRNYDPGAFAVLDDIFSGRSRIATVEWQDLSPFSADMENHMVSQSGSVPTKIRIVNESPVMLKIYWLNYQGNEFSQQILLQERASFSLPSLHIRGC